MKTNTKLGIDKRTLISAYKRSLLYANRKLRNFENSDLLRKLSPEDLANDAVVKTLSGRRPWNRTTCPELFVHLAGVIRSDIYNTYHGKDFSSLERGQASEDILLSTPSDEENIEVTVEFESKVKFVLDYLVQANKELKQVAEVVLRDGVLEPREIAKTLKISVEEVNTKKLALKRVMKRSEFLIHYISNNRPELAAIASAVYKHKKTNDEEISLQLGIPVQRVTLLREELDKAVKGIYQGEI